jgi:putative oxidoreductase
MTTHTKSNASRSVFSGMVPSSVMADVGLTVLRIFTGLAMALAHGLGKVQGPSEQFVEGVASMGFPMPIVFAWAAAITEFFGGILFAAGLLTRINAILLCGTMLVAGLLMHGMVRGDPFSGMEMALLYAAIFFAFIFTGSGRFSVDKMMR